MKASIVVQLWMKSGSYLIALTGCHDMAIDGGQDLDFIAQHALNIGGADESHGNIGANAFDGVDSMEAAQLPTIGVAAHLDVHRS